MPPTRRPSEPEAPLLLGGTLVRIVRSPDVVSSEIWGPDGWEESDIPLGDVLRSGIPASDYRLEQFGVPEADWPPAPNLVVTKIWPAPGESGRPRVALPNRRRPAH